MTTIIPAHVPGFVINRANDGTLTFITQPPGNTQTPQEVMDANEAATPIYPNIPGETPLILKTPVTIPNDALPSNLDELQVFLESNKQYTFRFRITRYSSDVPLDLGFVIPGDGDAATISWNDVRLDGVFLGDDDELELSTIGTDVIGVEVSGIVTVNSEGGFLIPQVRQDTADNQTSTVAEAYMEVTPNGN